MVKTVLQALRVARANPTSLDDATNESKDEESDADDSDKADSEDMRDAMAWQSKLDACELDADLTVETSKIESLENGELPSTVPATFRVDFELKPGSERLFS